uniref:Docking protein 2 n=1 Tax=Strix occidentalis caurina TaxID=311401 RepID=A0A8D0F0Y7_STROC
QAGQAGRQGIAFLQQGSCRHTRSLSCSTARLELFEGSAPPAAEKLRKGEGSKRLVKLSDCVHVAEVSGDAGCPKETVPFLLETTDKRYLLATDGTEVADWIQKLCELAFPVRTGRGSPGQFSMEENSLYSSRDKGRHWEFKVTVRATESSERCRLWGRFILRASEEALELRDFQTSEILYSWPYRFLRRFGRDKATFSFEAGRRCASGEGNFEFETRQGNEIFQVIESAINVHRAKLMMPPSSSPGTGELSGAFLPSRSADSPYTESCSSLHWGNPQVPEKGRRKDGPAKVATESEYAIPFDTIAKTFVAHKFSNLVHCPKEVPDPLYDSIKELGGQAGKQPPLCPTAAKSDHIYDEPEGLSAHTVYDEPEEVKGEAWRLQAAPEEPPGHEPVPLRQPFLLQGKEWLGDTEYDNVALKFTKKRNLQ